MFLKRVSRYIHLKPVEAGITDSPKAYAWNRYNAYLGNAAFSWLERDRVLALFGDNRNEALENMTESLKKVGNKINVRGQTLHVERTEIKMRRYFAAVSEMESLLKEGVYQHLCSPDWKDVFREFKDILFEKSQKSPEQLLEIKVPKDPHLALEGYRKTLIHRIEKAQSNQKLSMQALISLGKAKEKLLEYPFPEKAELR